MNPPVLPFDRSGTPCRALKDAYSDDAIRSFVKKLRHLATARPDECGALFRALDDTLTGMLPAPKPSEPRSLESIVDDMITRLEQIRTFLRAGQVTEERRAELIVLLAEFAPHVKGAR